MNRRLIYLFLCLGLFGTNHLLAQNSPQKPRPTVGVVLSGGGAKGFAHVPVLQLIDSLGIPVDYMAGTSMGALIGGLYSIGYTPDQLAELVVSENWNDILDDTPLRQDIPIWEKDVKQKRLIAVGVDFFKKSSDGQSMKLLLPSGLIQGQNVFDKLLELTRGHHDDINFKALPTKFLCVAADLRTAEEIVYTAGSLPDAMRGTMSIPTMFSPHTYEGELVVDGGAVNNLPSDHLKAMGCDIIIGVNVSTPFSHVQDNPSIGDILGQTGMFVDSKSVEERKALCNVLIEPDIYDFGITSFNSGEAILKKGREAAEKALPQLIEIVDLVKPTEHKRKTPYSFPDTINICDITIEGIEKLTNQYVLGKFAIPEDGRVSMNHLEERNKALYSSGTVEQSHFYLIPTGDDGYFHCKISIKEKQAPTTIGLGIHYDSDLKTSILFSIDASHLLFKESRFLADFVVSERPRINGTYLIDGGRKFGVGIDFNAHLNSVDLYNHRQYIGRYGLVDGDISAYLFHTKEVASVMKVGLEGNYFQYDLHDLVHLNIFDIPEDRGLTFISAGPFAHLTIDKLDDISVPSKGSLWDIKANYPFSIKSESLEESVESSFLSVKAQWKKPWRLSKKMTMVSTLHAGTNILNRPSPGFWFILGGVGDYFYNNQLPFYGFRYQEKNIAQSFLTTALDFRYQLGHSMYLSAIINQGFYNPEWDNYQEINLISGAGLKALLTTPVGPLSVTVHSPLEKLSIYGYLSFGFIF